MAVLISDNFETGVFSGSWTTSTSGAGSVAEVIAAAAYPNSSFGAHFINSPGATNGFGRASISYTAPASNFVCANFRLYAVSIGAGGTIRLASHQKGTPLFNNIMSIEVVSGTWQLAKRNRDGTSTGTNFSSNPALGAWHQLRMLYDATGTNPISSIYCDGVLQATYTDVTTGTIFVPDEFYIQTDETGFTATAEVYYDDVVVTNNDTHVVSVWGPTGPGVIVT